MGPKMEHRATPDIIKIKRETPSSQDKRRIEKNSKRLISKLQL